ncbi:hypothetical protein BX661DRAFT_144990 [Kickxella alabastrina]|uniref:uncharacterized protein n=1 Tax=Kickxella alabastrina TaxID=61397 RepID=UPI002220BCF0|nr:uncharacterized protein BX661DRAFT_144990 [Kickxella alabastrina]KAI7824282.1 hypothetical protein BX661DRAFT_144990 [Kickxella alabastrina]
MPDPRTFEQVVPFKYYAEWIKTQDGGRRMEQEDIRERYEDYRREALQRLYTQFFSVHKDDDWFCERFEPERRKEYMQKLASQKAENLRSFVSDLDSGKLDKLTLTATTEQVMQHEVNRRDLSSSNRLGGDDDDDGSESYTLFIRTVPPSVSRAVLEGELTKQPGFKHLSLSEPRQDKQYHRFGWVRFENGTDMDKAVESLSNINIDQFQFHFSRHNNVSSGIIRLTPDVCSTEERIRLDLKLAREAVRSVDEHTDREVDEKRVPEEGAADEDDQDDGEVKGNIAATRRELDLLVEYLRRVHYYCYYCGHTADNLEDFMRRCAKQHLRRGLPGNRSPQPSGNWTRNLDNRNDVIIHPLQAERLYKEGGKSLELETDKELDNHIKQLDEGRYRCLLCTKLFKGDAFVRKHIRNKHPEAVPETLVHEISFFNNFVREAPHLMMPGMMMPGMMAAPYMMPGMMPGMFRGGRANNGRGASSGGNRQDPRAVRSYVDLDAPAEGETDFGF